jgi:hypothetical protein
MDPAFSAGQGTLTLSWPSMPGTTYQLEGRPHAQSPWIFLTPSQTGTGAPLQRTLQTGTETNTQFRVRVAP